MQSTSLLESLSAWMPALPLGFGEAWAQLALFAVPACLYLAAVALPFMVLYGLIRAHYGRRSLFERCSRQQARLANILNWLFVLCAAGVAASGIIPCASLHPLYRVGLYAAAGLLLAGTLLWTVVVAAWKPLRQHPVLHGLLAFVAGSCLAALPVIGLVLGRVAMQGTELPQQNDWQIFVDLLLPAASDPFWLYLGFIHFLEVASAGALGLCWLIIRRRADDFGRDYYTFAARLCGEWAAWGGWIALFLAGGLCALMRMQGLLPLEREGVLLIVGSLLAALLIPAIVWTVIARSATPMRHKIGMVVSALLLMFAISNAAVLLLV